jgi:hypothetical protein
MVTAAMAVPVVAGTLFAFALRLGLILCRLLTGGSGRLFDSSGLCALCGRLLLAGRFLVPITTAALLLLLTGLVFGDGRLRQYLRFDRFQGIGQRFGNR